MSELNALYDQLYHSDIFPSKIANHKHNISLYQFYASFNNETDFRASYDKMNEAQRYYYYPTFDHYMDAINFSNGEYTGSTYIPDQFENYNADRINADTQAVLSRIMLK